MTQTIDPVKLKAAAEHLEWVLRQYPDSKDVQGMLHGLMPLIEDAKAGLVLEPLEWIPFGYRFGEGAYSPYANPSVEDAYVAFVTEMEGGLTDQEKRIITRISAMEAEPKS